MGAVHAQVKGEHSLHREPRENHKRGSDKNKPGGTHERLSLVTFFAAAKKVTPPPGRRLLNKKARNQNQNLNPASTKRTSRDIQKRGFLWSRSLPPQRKYPLRRGGGYCIKSKKPESEPQPSSNKKNKP
jgi:hypothetical protein